MNLYCLGWKCHRKSWVYPWQSCTVNMCLFNSRKSSWNADLDRELSGAEKGEFCLQGLPPVLVEWSSCPVLSPPPALCSRGTCRAGAETELVRPKRQQFTNTNPSHLITHLIMPSPALLHLPQPSLQFPRSFLCFLGFSAALHQLCIAFHPECPSCLPWAGWHSECSAADLELFTQTGHSAAQGLFGVFVLLGKGLINSTYW